MYKLRTPSSLTILAAKGTKDSLLAVPDDEAKFILFECVSPEEIVIV